MCLDEIEGLDVSQCVTCKVKVLSVDAPENIPMGYRKQDIKVGDASGTVKFTLWENEIGSMKERESYRISTAVVKEYNGEKYLSTLKNLSCIKPIADIGDVYIKDDSKDDRGTYI